MAIFLFICSHHPSLQNNSSGFRADGNLVGSCHPEYSGRQLSWWSKYATGLFYLQPKKIFELLLHDKKSLKRGIKIFMDKMKHGIL